MTKNDGISAYFSDIPDYKGREFAIAFMQNDRLASWVGREEEVNPELFITTESDRLVDVEISIPLWPELMPAKRIQVIKCGHKLSIRIVLGVQSLVSSMYQSVYSSMHLPIFPTINFNVPTYSILITVAVVVHEWVFTIRTHQ